MRGGVLFLPLDGDGQHLPDGAGDAKAGERLKEVEKVGDDADERQDAIVGGHYAVGEQTAQQ